VCSFGPGRADIRQHDFAGANTWVLRAINAQYPSFETGLTAQGVEESIARNISMLQRAGDLEVTDDGSILNVRITNQTGHKLPAGYVEGRRMWVNVVFRDDMGNVLEEFGGYDQATATLDAASTKVYEAKLGLTPDVASATGKTPGESFHFALNNEWLKDNRIPPMGFTNSAFELVQAAPVAYAYADGQHWDDTVYTIPAGAARAEVKLYYQTASREYIEFLRDTNTTDNAGQVMYDQWVLAGMGPPVEMTVAELTLDPVTEPCPADTNGDGLVTPADFNAWILAFNTQSAACDQNGDGLCTPADFNAWILNYNAGCP
jgi:hypothetical protein